MLQKLLDFERKNERWPRKQNRSSVPREEAKIGEWLARERVRNKNPDHKYYNAERAAVLRKCDNLGVNTNGNVSRQGV